MLHIIPKSDMWVYIEIIRRVMDTLYEYDVSHRCLRALNYLFAINEKKKDGKKVNDKLVSHQKERNFS